ncbi:halomucin [Prevotella falsenii]|uniref:halomucin n=1 Tax=Prevotella falsenii TaxID=515414 RepID=UPI000A5DFF34|nr:halomucin [Prevotella falsenii]
MKKNYIYLTMAFAFAFILGLKASPTYLGEQPKQGWSYDFETAKADKLGDRPNHYDLKLNGLAWSMYAVRRTGGANDFANGKYAARIYGSKMSMKEMPYMAMTEDKEGGIGTVEFVYRAYGEHTASQVAWCVQVSEDKGEHWETIGQPFTPTAEVQNFHAKANVETGRIRIVRTDYAVFDFAAASGYDAAFNLDDISITDCEAEAPDRPSIIANNDLLAFGEVNKGETKKLTLNITYKNLKDDISLTLSGESAPQTFGISTELISVSQAEGTGEVEVSFTPNSLGAHQAVLKLQSGETTTEVRLTGTAVRKAGEFTYSGGEGTKESPYLIGTAGDIEDLSLAVDTETDYAGKYFKLTKDIDMSGVSNMKPIGNNFGTDGSSLRAFSGTFDGDNHTISRLAMTFTGKNNLGVALFGILKDAKVMNLTLTDCHFEADAIVASIASVLVSSVLDNCHASENVTVKARLKPYAGGIATSAFLSPSSITDCTSRASVEAADVAAGGILGLNSIQGTTISRCINYGSVHTDGNFAGGIVGYVETGSLNIDDCLNAGDIKAQSYAGGLLGMGLQGASINLRNSYNIGRVEATD